MRIAIVPGSFDPITLGHLDIIQRASKHFDKIYVCVMVNAEKKSPMFSFEKRLQLVKASIIGLSNVEAETWDGLLVDYARQKKACAIVKGLRNGIDFDSEMQMARINKDLMDNLETIFMPASPDHVYISSTVARELIRYHQPIDKYVPSAVVAALEERT